MFKDVADAAVATIALFDQFDMALSSAEVWSYCAAYQGKPYSLGPSTRFWINSVEELLKSDTRLAWCDGLWTLGSRQELGRVRVARGFPVHERWAIAAKAARVASLVPFLKLFAVCNTLGYGVAKEGSDIDVLVIASRGRLWTVRFFLTLLLSLVRLRRHHNRVSKRICLSFYLATDALGVAGLAIDNGDPYLAWWVGSVVPLVDRGAYTDFITANRPFIERYRKLFLPRQTPPIVQLPITSYQLPRVFEHLLSGYLGDFLESALCFIQLRKIAQSSIGKHRENPTSVVVSDHVLKFHENDRRAAIRDQWLKRLEQLGIEVIG